jgi:hypothetical protein
MSHPESSTKNKGESGFPSLYAAYASLYIGQLNPMTPRDIYDLSLELYFGSSKVKEI